MGAELPLSTTSEKLGAIVNVLKVVIFVAGIHPHQGYVPKVSSLNYRMLQRSVESTLLRKRQ